MPCAKKAHFRNWKHLNFFISTKYFFFDCWQVNIALVNYLAPIRREAIIQTKDDIVPRNIICHWKLSLTLPDRGAGLSPSIFNISAMEMCMVPVYIYVYIYI